ncbi:Cut9-interacting protein scn1 [Pleosporales sp. CAS-2024a]
MASIEMIPKMKTRVLTVMATRDEDQALVMATADKHAITSVDEKQWSAEECIVPCFGWHPWFAHTKYLDPAQSQEPSQERLTGEAKVKHYQSVLVPCRETLSDEHRQIFLSLPDPASFARFLVETRSHLERYPYALIGEIGLDRSFRIPESWVHNQNLWAQRDDRLTPGGREGRPLTPFRCSLDHQKKICRMQLQLAAEMGRAVSVHGVQAHGAVFEVLQELWKGHEKDLVSSKRERKKRAHHHPPAIHVDHVPETSHTNRRPMPYPPRICLHSYSGNASNLKQYLNPVIPTKIFASFSTAINLSDVINGEIPRSFQDVVQTVPDDRLLVESDLHTAGEELDKRIEDITRKICTIKGWSLEKGCQQLRQNWRAFALGQT